MLCWRDFIDQKTMERLELSKKQGNILAKGLTEIINVTFQWLVAKLLLYGNIVWVGAKFLHPSVLVFPGVPWSNL